MKNKTKMGILSAAMMVAVGALAMPTAVMAATISNSETGNVTGHDVYAYLHQSKMDLGYGSTAEGYYSTAYGFKDNASGTYAVAVGALNNAGDCSQAVGFYNTANAEGASAFGFANKATGKYANAVGAGNTVSGEKSSAFGYKNTVTANNAIALGNNIETVANNSVVIGDASTSEEENTVSIGSEGGERKLVHVADGTDAHDAATVGQLANAAAGLNTRINQVETESNKGIAKASALAALHPLDYDPHNKLDIAAAGGFYKGENAFALGAFYRPNRNVMLSIGTTISGDDNAYNVGVSFKVGKSGKHTEAAVSTAELYAMIGAMQDKLDAQQKKIEELEANQAK